MSNYKKGILFPAGTPLANHYFVAKSGDDINAGTDPDLPKLTIQSALTACPDSGTVVIGGGVYEEFDLIDAGTGKTLLGDGLVYLRREFATLISVGTTLIFDSLDIRLYDSFGITQSSTVNCTVAVKTINATANAVESTLSTGNIFENVTINLAEQPSTPADAVLDQSIFINCIFNYGNNALTSIRNCHFSASTALTLNQISDSDQFVFNNINCGITMNGVLYPDLQGAKEFGSFQECIDVDADFNGELQGNYSLGPNSQLFGKGEFGINITGESLGFPFESTSSEIITGTGDVTFNELGEWISTGDSAQLITGTIDLFKIRKLGILSLIGIVDYINNVPDFDNKGVNVGEPNILDLEMKWSDTEVDLGAAPYQKFRWNEQPTFDGVLYNGQSGFDWSSQQSISARFVQLKIIVRNNYVA